jgi:high-affinity iron transporter
VLLSFVEQLMTTGTLSPDSAIRATTENPDDNGETSITSEHEKDDAKARHNLIKRMRIQIWAGTLAGFIIALAIGGAFIAVVSRPMTLSTSSSLIISQFYTKVKDLWADTEQIWEGVFSLIACIIIYMMGIAFLKMDRSRIKWRLKLSAAFEKSHSKAMAAENAAEAREKRPRWWKKEEGSGGKWALFLLPFITVIREGLEAVVFVGGVSGTSKKCLISLTSCV